MTSECVDRYYQGFEWRAIREGIFKVGTDTKVNDIYVTVEGLDIEATILRTIGRSGSRTYRVSFVVGEADRGVV